MCEGINSEQEIIIHTILYIVNASSDAKRASETYANKGCELLVTLIFHILNKLEKGA